MYAILCMHDSDCVSSIISSDSVDETAFEILNLKLIFISTNFSFVKIAGDFKVVLKKKKAASTC